MLGYLLARAGIDVVVLEKHPDFLRDFRGDTVHPSTLEVMHELGILDEFLELPHQKVTEMVAFIGDQKITPIDLSHLPTQCKFIAFMPQWDFLNFVAQQGQRYPTFKLLMQTQVTDLLYSGDQVTGVKAENEEGVLEIQAKLVVAADGRASVLRDKAGLEVMDLGAPMDALWMSISRLDTDPQETMGRLNAGRMMVMLNRGTYWQCAYIIPKGGFEKLREQGIESLHADMTKLAPFLRSRVKELSDWDDLNLLVVKVDRLRQWYRPGLLCIGDAAHAMSPVGGIGINLAIKDSVAAANILAQPLVEGTLTLNHLKQVQKRRLFPTRVTQRFQVFAQKNIIGKVLADDSGKPTKPPLSMRILNRFPYLRRFPARFLGTGFRLEHVNDYILNRPK